MRLYEVTSMLWFGDFVMSYVKTICGHNPDEVCGIMLGAMRGVFGDDAEIVVKRIVKQNIGGEECGVA